MISYEDSLTYEKSDSQLLRLEHLNILNIFEESTRIINKFLIVFDNAEFLFENMNAII